MAGVKERIGFALEVVAEGFAVLLWLALAGGLVVLAVFGARHEGWLAGALLGVPALVFIGISARTWLRA
jgi:hypothetical protein